jgi:dihydrofolate reductase (trimethoprim resistance protein)
MKDGAFEMGDLVKKKSGSQWRGKVCGFYKTELTPIGYCVESLFEPGSVQIYPGNALEIWLGEAQK